MNTDFIKPIVEALSKHAPDILIGLGITGIATTAIVAVKNSKKHEQRMKWKEEEKGAPLTKKEKVVETIKDYAPAVGVGVVSAACILVGTTELHKRISAVTALCAIAENSLTDYKKEVKELVGEEKAAEIDDKVEISRAKRLEELNKNQFCPQVVDAYSSLQPFYDLYSGRPFYCSENAIQKVVNELNANMNDGCEVSLNDFYDMLDLEPVQLGNDLVWTIEDGLISVRFGAYRDNNGIARTSISFSPKPNKRYGYR